MARKCWSSTVGAQRGTKVRVFEREPGGRLYITWWEDGRAVKRSLGHTARAVALQEAQDLAAQRVLGAAEEWPSNVTMGTLLSRYREATLHNRDGSLKTEQYQRERVTWSRYLMQHFGPECPVATLRPDRMHGYIVARRDGRISGRPVRIRAVEAELRFLKSALQWATNTYELSRPLLERNPLSGYRPPREQDPRRPRIRAETVTALLGVAERVNPALPLLLQLMDATGHRLSSVLGLRWSDFDFEAHTIRWRAALDKRRKTGLTPMPVVVAETLRRTRHRTGAIGSALVFPSPRNSAKPVSKYLAGDWPRRAYREAGCTREPGGLWHPFRRKWATERKHYPLRDVAAAGGWSDTQTLLRCYQQPDTGTMRAVVNRESQPESGSASAGAVQGRA